MLAERSKDCLWHGKVWILLAPVVPYAYFVFYEEFAMRGYLEYLLTALLMDFFSSRLLECVSLQYLNPNICYFFPGGSREIDYMSPDV